ncbi:hypothetical protein M9434_004860 [Picochlorum sp. BPE23]|nr:hypothetical protein M9434_004860 [Picochlorum sp. BPE23]
MLAARDIGGTRAFSFVGRPVTGIQRIGGARVPRRRFDTNKDLSRIQSSSSDGAITPDGIIGPDGEIVKRAPLDPAESKALWKRAIKLPMYSVGIAPVLLSATAAFVYTGAFQPLKTLGLCIASAAIIAWLNLSNDVFDSATGVDKNKAESVVNLTGDWRKVFLIANAFFILGVGILFSIIAQVPNEFVTKALYAAICCGYLYQGPPFRWSYLGLGEPLCFLAFGPLATNAFYLAQIPAALAIPEAGASVFSVIPSSMWALSTFLGLSTTIILFCSHFHQIDGDKAAGKQSPVVRMGIEKSTSTLKFLVGCLYTVMLVLCLFGVLPFATWTSGMISYGFAAEMVKFAEDNGNKPADLKNLKFLATKWHIAFSSMLVLGLIVSKLMVM